jgi:hypothetical protein
MSTCQINNKALHASAHRIAQKIRSTMATPIAIAAAMSGAGVMEKEQSQVKNKKSEMPANRTISQRARRHPVPVVDVGGTLEAWASTAI